MPRGRPRKNLRQPTEDVPTIDIEEADESRSEEEIDEELKALGGVTQEAVELNRVDDRAVHERQTGKGSGPGGRAAPYSTDGRNAYARVRRIWPVGKVDVAIIVERPGMPRGGEFVLKSYDAMKEVPDYDALYTKVMELHAQQRPDQNEEYHWRYYHVGQFVRGNGRIFMMPVSRQQIAAAPNVPQQGAPPEFLAWAKAMGFTPPVAPVPQAPPQMFSPPTPQAPPVQQASSHDGYVAELFRQIHEQSRLISDLKSAMQQPAPAPAQPAPAPLPQQQFQPPQHSGFMSSPEPQPSIEVLRMQWELEQARHETEQLHAQLRTAAEVARIPQPAPVPAPHVQQPLPSPVTAFQTAMGTVADTLKQMGTMRQTVESVAPSLGINLAKPGDVSAATAAATAAANVAEPAEPDPIRVIETGGIRNVYLRNPETDRLEPGGLLQTAFANADHIQSFGKMLFGSAEEAIEKKKNAEIEILREQRQLIEAQSRARSNDVAIRVQAEKDMAESDERKAQALLLRMQITQQARDLGIDLDKEEAKVVEASTPRPPASVTAPQAAPPAPPAPPPQTPTAPMFRRQGLLEGAMSNGVRTKPS